jgi:hypothetical protein
VAFRLAPDGMVASGSRCRCTRCRSEARPQVVEAAEVGGRLEHPSVGGLAALPLLPLQQLEHPVEVVIGRREVLGVDPGAVRRHVRAGLGDVGEERVGKEDDLLLGLTGVHRVDRVEVGRPLARELLAGLGLRDPRVGDGPVVAEPRRALDDLPAVRAVEPVVGRESSRCTSVVPLRIMPTTTTGAATISSAISRCRRNHSVARSRIRRLCTVPDLSRWVPTSVRSAVA